MTDQELLKIAEEKLVEYRRFQREGLICLDGEFFPSVHYPPITMYPPTDEERLFKGYTNPSDGLFIIYAHIPFCMQYCNFCHYPNLIGDLPEEKARYIAAMEKEMDIYMRRLGLKTIKARSILIGGGTPTYLTPAMLDKFLKMFTSRLDLSSCTQFNYDVDPLTLLGPDGDERFKILKSYGVDRLTIGFQSLNDGLLKAMNRPHTAAQAVESAVRAKAAGFQVCIEFIYGYPGETLETWMATVRDAAKVGVEEIQLYHLKVIPYGDHAGLISKNSIAGKKGFFSPETMALMKEVSRLILEEAGYKENLTRVFTTKPKYFSHYAADQCCNLCDQVSFGITAFSSLRDRFGLNTQRFNEYYKLIEQDKLPLNRGMIRSHDEQIRWNIVLPLKNRRVFKKQFEKSTGVSLNTVFRRKIERLKDFGLLHEDENSLVLTPLGRFFADEICHQFHSVQYIPFPREAYSPGPLNPYNDPEP